MKPIFKIFYATLFLMQSIAGYAQTPPAHEKTSDDEEPMFYTQAIKEWKKQLKEWKKPVPKSFELYEVKLPGETVKNIARLYKILPEDIYANNADAVNGLKIGMILEIPRYDKVSDNDEETKIIYVKEILVSDAEGETFEKKIYALKLGKNETLQSLSQEFDVTIEEIIKLNPKAINEGVKQGTEIKLVTSKLGIPSFGIAKIPTNQAVDTKVEEPQKTVSEPLDDIIPTKTDSLAKIETKTIEKPELKADEHWVEPKETLYSLSKKYNLSLADIFNLNPDVATNGLKEHSIIKVKKDAQMPENKAIISEKEPIQEAKIPVKNTETVPDGTIVHEVVSGETLFGLSRKYKISIDLLSEMNPKLRDGLKIGQKLTIKPQEIQKISETFVEKKREIVSSPIPTETKTTSNTENNKPKNPVEHIVKSGDNIVKIAEKYGIKIEELLEDNSFLIDNDLLEGQKLKIRQHK